MNFFDLENATTTAQLLGLVIPFLVAIVTKKVASSGLKGVLNLVLSAIAGSTVYLVAADGGYDVQGFVNATMNVFIVSIATYYGVTKPTGLTETVQNVTSGFGLGTKPTLQTDDAVAAIEIPAEHAAVLKDEEPILTAPITAAKKATPRKRAPKA